MFSLVREDKSAKEIQENEKIQNKLFASKNTNIILNAGRIDDPDSDRYFFFFVLFFFLRWDYL